MDNQQIQVNDIQIDIEKNIKVSVIMPIYNAYDYLRVAIDSVLTQSLTDIELICIEDGSTDRSLDIIKEYQKSDHRVRILTEANAGPAVARNRGIERARGEYLAFLDADDFFEPTLLEKLYNTAKLDELDIAISDYDIYNSKTAKFEKRVKNPKEDIFLESRVVSKSDWFNEIFQSTTGSAWNKLFRRSFVVDKKLQFLTDVRTFEDVYFTVCALAYAERVGKVQEILLHHRIHSQQERARTFGKYHSQVPVVYCAIKEFLVHNGMYAPLSYGFLNLSASRCYKIFNILPRDKKDDFYNLLRENLKQLDWLEKTESDFDEKEVFSFVAALEMFNYKQYVKKHADTISLDVIKNKLQNTRFVKKIFSIFKKK